MSDLEPRWGGSVEDMEAFAARARKELADVTAANRVAARVPAYRAFEQRTAKDMSGALKYLDEAIALDADAAMLCERSFVLMEFKREAEAFSDVKRGAIQGAGKPLLHEPRGVACRPRSGCRRGDRGVDPRARGGSAVHARAEPARLALPEAAASSTSAFQDYLASAKAGDA